MCGLFPCSRCLSSPFFRLTARRFGCPSRLRMAFLRSQYHFRAALEYSALISSYRWARSRSAREVMLTTYSMLGFELVEKFLCRPNLSFFHVLEALADAFFCVDAGGNVEQALIGFSILHDGSCFPLHRKHHRALAFLELLHKVAGTAAERRQ